MARQKKPATLGNPIANRTPAKRSAYGRLVAQVKKHAARERRKADHAAWKAIKVSLRMRRAGEAILAGSPELDATELATRVYRAMAIKARESAAKPTKVPSTGKRTAR